MKRLCDTALALYGHDKMRTLQSVVEEGMSDQDPISRFNSV
eukprot:CAMPEP_0184686798 /NCGR_PEP_ID=MMETSP0312-20130426/24086_1 /TAXON_ID=31354 /ORGANISM="Compsopogon coeruleus, Strain SAG 36.94" /LENGTH=40 /DNA_ID= /DNA_START= /DNA_END= /DNA_ORIENTATION=